MTLWGRPSGLSHRAWKSLRDSHIPPVSAAATLFQNSNSERNFPTLPSRTLQAHSSIGKGWGARRLSGLANERGAEYQRRRAATTTASLLELDSGRKWSDAELERNHKSIYVDKYNLADQVERRDRLRQTMDAMSFFVSFKIAASRGPRQTPSLRLLGCTGGRVDGSTLAPGYIIPGFALAGC
jgi:hypothetical protein